MLAEFGEEAVPYCGGTELLLVMKLGLVSPAHLIDVKRIHGLRGLSWSGRALRVGAAVTHRAIETDPETLRRFPALSKMSAEVANLRVRSTGSLGGNLCFADPHSDPATFLIAAGAEVECSSGDVSRSVPMSDFFAGPYRTVLEPNELLVGVRVPAPPEQEALVHRRFRFRERPAATVAVAVRVKEETVSDARVVVGSVNPVPARSAEAEGALLGADQGSVETRLTEAAEAAAAGCDPIVDADGDEAYKRQLVRVLVVKAAGEAFIRALQAVNS
jgi:carbon-monoxide dehydrogenase medium subunit